MSVTPIKPGGDIAAVDCPKLANDLYNEIWELLYTEKYRNMTLAATLGVLALLEHRVIRNQDES